jgi:hypothetical protein
LLLQLIPQQLRLYGRSAHPDQINTCSAIQKLCLLLQLIPQQLRLYGRSAHPDQINTCSAIQKFPITSIALSSTLLDIPRQLLGLYMKTHDLLGFLFQNQEIPFTIRRKECNTR